MSDRSFDEPSVSLNGSRMKGILNTRTLVGNDHDRAAEFVSEYLPDVVADIEWMQSPSARCVLDLIPPDSELQIQLELALRDHLGLAVYEGDDASETEAL